MHILKMKPEQKPERVDIPDTLEAMQKVVGGYIQAVYPFEEPVALICNEEGKLNGLPLNRALWDEDGNLYDIISGTFFLCAAPPDAENFQSLSEEQLVYYEERFHCPEMFLNVNGKLICLPRESIRRISPQDRSTSSGVPGRSNKIKALPRIRSVEA